ncbi:hypothetical protein QO003_000838 [Arthrobacter silviterrae]|uniref:Uncharacterized protein n=1 Tax=Arthrobacter silviterrae TaxID=2026658 RepID=A0ABX0DF41_9MICC|nr:hypothetical protein [Arthrobacter silviterrae]MDQ0276535.1 hypothetical protein [Arthrobacter silviterrae]NGN85201.1 hypothetical protein [Arthrobacter silviterrae]
MELGGWISTIVAGLLSGLLGGIWSAAVIARKGEVARKRYVAELATWRELATYRDLLRYDHDQVYVQQSFPVKYAEIKGQQQLAEKVLVHLPVLGRKTRSKLYRGLYALVGPTSLSWIEKYLYVPEEQRNAEGDGIHQVVEQYKAIKDEKYQGAISALLRTQNKTSEHQELYDKIMAMFDELMALVAPDRPGPCEKIFGRITDAWRAARTRASHLGPQL